MNTSFNAVSRHPVASNGALRTIGSVNDMDELAAHMVGASLSARCHAECPLFEPRCYYQPSTQLHIALLSYSTYKFSAQATSPRRRTELGDKGMSHFLKIKFVQKALSKISLKPSLCV